MSAVIDYDEFGLFHENISEFALSVAEVPTVERVDTVVDGGTSVVVVVVVLVVDDVVVE